MAKCKVLTGSAVKGLKASSSYKPTQDPLRTLVLRVFYLLTYLLTYYTDRAVQV